MNCTFVLASVVLACGIASSPSKADSAQILTQISDTADRLCGNVGESGHSTNTEVKGDVKAELNGLAKRLAELGLTGTGTIRSEEYEGVLQQDLTENLKNVRDCRLKVFSYLQDKLLPAQPAEVSTHRNPNALYQYGELVADIQGASISQSSGVVFFQEVRTYGKADSVSVGKGLPQSY
jgi:hypothetical protein